MNMYGKISLLKERKEEEKKINDDQNKIEKKRNEINSP